MQELTRMILGSALVLLAPVITISNEHDVAPDRETEATEERIQRTLGYRDQVIEQLQLPGKPQITVIVNYKKNAAKPMPVMLGWFGQRDSKIAELTKHLSATEGMTVTEELPPMQPIMAKLVDRGCALVSFQNDPDRLQFVVFEGAGHGWDQKWNTFMVVDWFDRYLIQDEPPKPRPRRHSKSK